MNVWDWVFVIILVLVLQSFLILLVFIFRKNLRIGTDEREKVFQAKIEKLEKELEESNKEIESLRKQVNFLVEQNEESVRKMVHVEQINTELKEKINSFRRNPKLGYYLDSPQRVLIVVIGSHETGMALDLASIRAVKTDTGLDIQTVSDVTPDNLKRVLDAARRRNNHIYVHLSVKADKEGYLIGNAIVDVAWLSSILEDVIVLLVAGADSNYVGEFLGVVPYVVTMRGDIAHRDAALFTRAFWTEIGKGIGPSMSLKRALERSPITIRDNVVAHWNP